MGAMKQGRGICGTFKAFNLIYLHVLRCSKTTLVRLLVHFCQIIIGKIEHLTNIELVLKQVQTD